MYLTDAILRRVEKPARYTGGELNAVHKEKNETDVRFALCFADTYEIGMSHLGMKLLYELLNSRSNFWCERVFAPWVDLEKIMREKNLKLFALESQEEIKNFDFIGFTLQYELSYTNVINMIDLAGLPVYSKDRTDDMPIIIGGGPSCMNPEPLSDFFDIFNIGDGEEMLPEILDLYVKCKSLGLDKDAFLFRAAQIPGVYVPKYYEEKYDEDGTFLGVFPKIQYKNTMPEKIKRRVISDFDNAFIMKSQVVPYVEAIHDRIMLEIFRGCIRGCRFCQAGYIYRPYRERSADKILKQAMALTEKTGYEEISLLSLATDDYSELKELTDALIPYTDSRKMNLCLPSLRIDSFTMDLMEKISKVRKSGITFAPEAGTQRLRDVINKGITEEDLVNSCRLAFEGGHRGVKLYFMIGLPTETDEDLLGIAYLARKIRDVYFEVHQGEKVKYPNITVSVSTFVPKAFTPFQWYPQISYDEIKRRLRFVKDNLGPRFGFSWQDPELSVAENFIARGDKRAGTLLYNVWKRSGGFDSWNEMFDWNVWKEEYEKLGCVCGINGAEEISDVYDINEMILPWEIVDIGVTRNFFESELEKAIACETTENCRQKCSGCGANCFGGGVCFGK